jgi:hypothetical protein
VKLQTRMRLSFSIRWDDSAWCSERRASED